MKSYVQYGAGNQHVPGWLNFDASPTLRIQKIPLPDRLLKNRLNCIFDDEVQYGDIVKGLPIDGASAGYVFSLHILEHLALDDFHTAFNNTFRTLKKGGVFRVIVPDLRMDINDYLRDRASDDVVVRQNASINFCKNSCLGMPGSGVSLIGRISYLFGNSSHRWMWHSDSLTAALSAHGFIDIKPFKKDDSDDEMLLLPEKPHQFERGIAYQCRKL